MSFNVKVELELKGERLANKLRLFLTLFFAIGSGLAYAGGQIDDVFHFYVMAVGLYFLMYLFTSFWLRKNWYHSTIKYYVTVIEYFALYLVNFSFLLMLHPYNWIGSFNNPGRFAIYFLFLGMAGSRFSPPLVYLSGGLAILSHFSLMVLCGLKPGIEVVFSVIGEPTNRHVPILSLIIDVMFLSAMTVLTSAVSRYSRDLVAEAQEARQSAASNLSNLENMFQTARLNISELSTALGTLSAISRRNEEASSDQLVSVEETSATMEEMSASIQGVADQADRQYRLGEQNSANMQTLLNLVERLKNASDTARKNGQLTLQNAQEGEKELGRAVDGISRIEKGSREITEIVTVINEIAEKINLLALNAAIEAARAGQEGRGFAVVAQEMGKLAEMSANNAGTIARLIGSAQKDTTEGVEAISNTLSAIQNIVTGIKDIVTTVADLNALAQRQEENAQATEKSSESFKRSAREIRDAARELSGGGSEILKAMDIINNSAEKFKDSTESLAEMARSLHRILDRLKESIPSGTDR